MAFDLSLPGQLAGPPRHVPPGLPILVMNGSQDVVGGFLGGGEALARAYRELGVTDVTYLGYEGARHELFNETNRDQVLADMTGWLDGHVGTLPG